MIYEIKKLLIEVYAGAVLEDAIKQATKLSKEKMVPVEFIFNGVTYTVKSREADNANR